MEAGGLVVGLAGRDTSCIGLFSRLGGATGRFCRTSHDCEGLVSRFLETRREAFRFDESSLPAFSALGRQAEELDLDSMLAEGALIVEWPERMAGLIPAERLWVNLEHVTDEEREMKFNAHGRR